MKGILFKPEMIKAIVEGRKTVTRRVIKPQPELDAGGYYWNFYSKDGGRIRVAFYTDKTDDMTKYARYQPNEVVYIKEAWAISNVYDNYEPSDPIIKDDTTVPIHWLLDSEKPDWCGRTRSPMHLLANKARYFIQITDVRAERLQEITVEDCIAEGHPFGAILEGLNDTQIAIARVSRRGWYQSLWDSINKDHPWQSNLWVWRYAFSLTGGE